MWNHILFHIPTTCVTAATVAGTVTATVAGSLTTQVFDIAWVDLRAPTADDYKPVTPLPCLDSTMFLVTPDAATTYNAQNPTLAALTAGCKAACPAPYDTPMNRVCTSKCPALSDSAFSFANSNNCAFWSGCTADLRHFSFASFPMQTLRAMLLTPPLPPTVFPLLAGFFRVQPCRMPVFATA